MKLAVADPPYPPYLSERNDLADGTARMVLRSRARRYYGDGARSAKERPADHHPAAGDWDDPAMHRALLEQLRDEFDGWAIATSMDGLTCYQPLPVPARIMVWQRLRPAPTAHRIASTCEAVILYPAVGRRGRVSVADGPAWQVPDLLAAAPPSQGFVGAKPAAWTRWVLDALGYDPDVDELHDLFPGSGAVSAAAAQGVLL